MELKPRCYKCKTEDGIMASIFACGEYYMCDLCIMKEKNTTGKIAVFSGLKGLEFVNKDKLEELLQR